LRTYKFIKEAGKEREGEMEGIVTGLSQVRI
jgi:hypothetical protein